MGNAMGGLAEEIFPVRRDIDVQMDDADCLPSVHLNMLDSA